MNLPLQIQIAAITHRGRVRRHNEDAIAVGSTVLTDDMDQPMLCSSSATDSLMVIADGMGGHVGGSVASQQALKALSDFGHRPTPDQLVSVLNFANDRLYEIMRQQPVLNGMGTTIVGALFHDGGISFFNVGDSRGYRHSRGQLTLVTHDDVPLGTFPPNQRRKHSLVTQCLGGYLSAQQISPHIDSTPPLSKGETILLCSDGLTDMITDTAISQVLDKDLGLSDSVFELFTLAMKAGGADNISIAIARSV